MKLKITKPFAFAHRGCDVVQYTAGQEVDTEDQELIDTALTEKWATKAREARQNKAIPGAPEKKGVDSGEGSGEEGSSEFPEQDPDHKGGENNPLTDADAAADLAGEPRPA